MPQPIAISCSDIHLRHTAPLCRQGESDWYKAMGRVIDKLVALKDKFGVPILCCGDIFHRWNPPLELVNWAILHLPKMYAIPGQHDLPYHSYKDVERSAFWTLVMAGTITPLTSTPQKIRPRLVLHPYIYGVAIGPRPDNPSKNIHVLMAHQFIWRKGAAYGTAPKHSHINQSLSTLKNYDFSLFGDNHISFTRKFNNRWIINNGSIMVQSTAEADHDHFAWVLFDDGSCTGVNLNDEYAIIDRNTLILPDELVESDEMKKVVEALAKDRIEELDFTNIVYEWLKRNHETRMAVREKILKALESKNE